MPPSLEVLGSYQGFEQDGYKLPAFLDNITATVSKIVGPSGKTRIFMEVQASLSGLGAANVFEGLIDYSAKFSSFGIQYFVASAPQGAPCTSDTGGGFQYVKFVPATGILSIDGLFYGIGLKKIKN